MITQFLSKNDCYKQGRKLKVQGITVHSTGANNPNINRYVPIGQNHSSLHWDKPGITKCVHAFIGKMPNGTIGTCQTLPWDMRGWHAGKGTKGSFNDSRIGFEVCEDDLIDSRYFMDCIYEAADLCAYLCILYNLDPHKDIASHHESHLMGYASNHADIDHWMKIQNFSMDKFRDLVSIFMSGDEKEMTFKEEFDNMQKELMSQPFSQWARDEHVQKWAVDHSISSADFPQCYVTQEQVLTMLKRMWEQLTGENN